MEEDNDLLVKRKKEAHTNWSDVSRCSHDMTWIFNWVGVIRSNYEVRQQEHHSWICAVLNFIVITTTVNLGNYGICSYLFVLCSISLLRSRCAEPPQVTEASKASQASKAPQGPQSPQVGKVWQVSKVPLVSKAFQARMQANYMDHYMMA